MSDNDLLFIILNFRIIIYDIHVCFYIIIIIIVIYITNLREFTLIGNIL